MSQGALLIGQKALSVLTDNRENIAVRSWQANTLPKAVARTIFKLRGKGQVLREIASTVGYSRETVRLVLKADGRFPSRIPCKKRIKAVDKRLIHTKPRLSKRKKLLEEASARRAQIMRLRKAGRSAAAIARRLEFPISIVSATIRKSQPPLNHADVGNGLCVKCGGKRNQFARLCDGCHEESVFRDRDRSRRKYKRTARCNAIGCRRKPVEDGFCGSCHHAWQVGTIDEEGKHVLVHCVSCPCRFIPSGEDQKHCLVCLHTITSR